MRIEIYRDNLEPEDIKNNPQTEAARLIVRCQEKILASKDPVTGQIGFLRLAAFGLEPDLENIKQFCMNKYRSRELEATVTIVEYCPKMTYISRYYRLDIPGECPDLSEENREWIDIYVLLNRFDEEVGSEEFAYEKQERDFIALVNSI
ncbi:MAG: hypothetical protein JXB20_02225 [Bacilli bacterium]|nr:hypothetical protein [Bacilli bacterium]